MKAHFRTYKWTKIASKSYIENLHFVCSVTSSFYSKFRTKATNASFLRVMLSNFLWYKSNEEYNKNKEKDLFDWSMKHVFFFFFFLLLNVSNNTWGVPLMITWLSYELHRSNSGSPQLQPQQLQQHFAPILHCFLQPPWGRRRVEWSLAPIVFCAILRNLWRMHPHPTIYH